MFFKDNVTYLNEYPKAKNQNKYKTPSTTRGLKDMEMVRINSVLTSELQLPTDIALKKNSFFIIEFNDCFVIRRRGFHNEGK